MYYISAEESDEGYTKLGDKGKVKETSSGIEAQCIFYIETKIPFLLHPPPPKCSTYLHNEKLFPDSSKSEKEIQGHYRQTNKNQFPVKHRDNMWVNANLEGTSKEEE